MRKRLAVLLGLVLFGASPALAGGINVDLDVHLRNRAPAPVIVREPPPAPVIVSEPPLFLESIALGLQVAVRTRYPMFHDHGSYFLFRDGRWLAAPGYNGPWVVVRHDRLPRGLARRRDRDIFAVREAESEKYRRGHYHGRTFRPRRVEYRREELRRDERERVEHRRPEYQKGQYGKNDYERVERQRPEYTKGKSKKAENKRVEHAKADRKENGSHWKEERE